VLLPLPGVSATCFVHSHVDIDMCMQTVMDLIFIAGIDIEDDQIFVSTTARPVVGSLMPKNADRVGRQCMRGGCLAKGRCANVVFKTSVRM
jgi:hypothetical protein